MGMMRSEAKERSSVACGGGVVKEAESLSLMARRFNISKQGG